MPTLPATDSSLLVRTAFDDHDAWSALVDAVARETDEGFRAHVHIVDDAEWKGATASDVREAARRAGATAAVAFVADLLALRDDLPILVVDLSDGDHPPFRCIASELWGVENNLDIANMDWPEFADAVDGDGVFRGFA